MSQPKAKKSPDDTKAKFLAADQDHRRNTGKSTPLYNAAEMRFLSREVEGIRGVSKRLTTAADAMLELMAAIPRSNPNYFLILEVNSAISKTRAESATLLAELESKQRQQQFLRDQELAKKLQRQENLRQQQALSAHDEKMAALRKARGIDEFAEQRMKQTKMLFRQGGEAGPSKARNVMTFRGLAPLDKVTKPSKPFTRQAKAKARSGVTTSTPVDASTSNSDQGAPRKKRPAVARTEGTSYYTGRLRRSPRLAAKQGQYWPSAESFSTPPTSRPQRPPSPPQIIVIDSPNDRTHAVLLPDEITRSVPPMPSPWAAESKPCFVRVDRLSRQALRKYGFPHTCSQTCAGLDAGAEKAAQLDQEALDSQAPLSVQEVPLQHVTAAADPVPDGRDYRQTEPPTHYHTPQPVVETLDEVLQAVAEATQACAAGELNKSNSTITLSDDSVEVLTSDEPAAANDDVEVVVLDETTDK